jgi:hypothetical protein
MKLKKQLAEDFLIKSGTWNEGMDGFLFNEYEAIFLAGFEAARAAIAHRYMESYRKYALHEQIESAIGRYGEEEAK